MKTRICSEDFSELKVVWKSPLKHDLGLAEGACSSDDK